MTVVTLVGIARAFVACTLVVVGLRAYLRFGLRQSRESTSSDMPETIHGSQELPHHTHPR